MSAAPLPLTVIIHTRNEEANIRECLQSCIGWASEVLVADMQSSDSTAIIARSEGAKVVEMPLLAEFDAARNISAEQASSDWILFLDADERLTAGVKKVIAQLLSSPAEHVAAFQLPFRVISFGTWIQYAGNWWPSYKSPPLLRKGKFRFPGPVHLPAEVDGQVVRVPAMSPEDAIQHYSHPTLEAYFEKLNRYTTLEAKKLQSGERTASWEAAAERLGQTARWYYDDSGGKRDGLAGFFLSLASGFYEAVSEMKYMEATSSESIPPTAEAFFERALMASVQSRSEQIGQKVPAWSAMLCSWYGADPARAIRSFDTFAALADVSRFIESHSGGEFALLQDRSRLDPQDVRLHLDRAFDSRVHLLECAKEGRWWFGWKGGGQAKLKRMVSVAHAGALKIMGGGEVQLFQSIKALREFCIYSDVGVGMLPPLGYTFAHVYSLHLPGLTQQLSDRNLTYILSPIYWDRTELAWVAPRLKSIFGSCESRESIDAGFEALRAQRESVLKALADQSLPEGATELILGAKALLVNAESEFACLLRSVPEINAPHHVIPNAAIAPSNPGSVQIALPEEFVLCVGRIEPNKNQLALLYALQDYDLPVVIVGAAADRPYADMCRLFASPRSFFAGPQPAEAVAALMGRAAVHCLPSFGETPGLANLEAALAGCPIVVGNRSAEREYFGEYAEYCDPLDPNSIRQAVDRAREHKGSSRVTELKAMVLERFSWDRTAEALFEVYMDIDS